MTKRVKPREWLWVTIFAIAVMAVSCVPYIVGAVQSNDAWRFSGFVIGVEDGNSYLAKMQLGAHGQWLFQLSYAIEQHPRALLNLFYILLGKLAGWLAGTDDPIRLHTALVIAYHAARVIFGAALLLVSYRFVAEIVPQARQRRFALMLISLGGGLGWLLIALGAPGLPLEFYSPESFTFLDLFSLPHLAASRACFLSGLLCYLWAVRGRWPWLFGAAASWLVMTLIQPFYMVIIFALLALHVAILALLTFRQTEAELQRGVDIGATAAKALWVAAAAGGAGLPLVVYTFLLFAVDPVYHTWGLQNVIVSPAPWHYLSAWGLLIVFAVFGLRSLYRRNLAMWVLIVGWFVILPLLLYAPYNLQRRFAEGVQVPLAALAVLGLTAGFGARPAGRMVRRYAPPFLLALTIPSTALLWVGGITMARHRAEPVFQTAEQVATYDFIARSLPPRAFVLSSYQFGNALPAYAYVVAYIGHGPETPNLESKRAVVREFYNASTLNSVRLASYSVISSPYVVVGPHEREIGAFDPAAPRQAGYLVKLYDSGGYSVWSLRPGP